MIGSYALPSLLVLATIGPELAMIDENRFRVSIVFDDTGIRGHAKAQIKLIKTAKKYCRGKGRAISEGSLELNKAEPIRKGKRALELIKIYSCVPKK